MPTKDFADFISAQLDADPNLREEIARERLNASIAALILRERKRAGLTQTEMAKLVGTHQSVIARLEDAEYGGHSLSMLWKIADALGEELRVEFARPVETVTVNFNISDSNVTIATYQSGQSSPANVKELRV